MRADSIPPYRPLQQRYSLLERESQWEVILAAMHNIIAVLNVTDRVHGRGAVLVLIPPEDCHARPDDPGQRKDPIWAIRPPLDQLGAIAVQIEGPQIGIQLPARALLELRDLGSRAR